MKDLLDHLQRWIPTLLSKKLGVAIMVFVAELKTNPHQTTRQWAIAIVGAAYIAAQAYLDVKTSAPTIVEDPHGGEPIE